MNKYKCAQCKITFETTWADKEVLAEKEKLFGNIPLEQCSIICDNCFQKLNSIIYPQLYN